MTKISIFHKNFDFWPKTVKSRILGQIIFDSGVSTNVKILGEETHTSNGANSDGSFEFNLDFVAPDTDGVFGVASDDTTVVGERVYFDVTNEKPLDGLSFFVQATVPKNCSKIKKKFQIGFRTYVIFTFFVIQSFWSKIEICIVIQNVNPTSKFWKNIQNIFCHSDSLVENRNVYRNSNFVGPISKFQIWSILNFLF